MNNMQAEREAQEREAQQRKLQQQKDIDIMDAEASVVTLLIFNARGELNFDKNCKSPEILPLTFA